ncbi:MAG: ATP phosphoribosyltransferase [Clostridiales bacterium]|nr:ATP phosphoribosyltransferase [Clostridiales bacterium]
MLSIALPKGRLGNSVYNLFEAIGYDCPEINDETRKLVFINEEKDIKYLLVKPSDVAVYVEKGAADIGVIGSDILFEGNSDVYELLDLNLGKCKMCIAAENGWNDDLSLPLRVASKYPNTASRYFDSISRRIEIIKLNGSIELAPLLGMSDVIVDIVETGGTLKGNDLSVVKEIENISARLIANKSSYQFKKEKIDKIVENMNKIVEE